MCLSPWSINNRPDFSFTHYAKTPCWYRAVFIAFLLRHFKHVPGVHVGQLPRPAIDPVSNPGNITLQLADYSDPAQAEVRWRAPSASIVTIAFSAGLCLAICVRCTSERSRVSMLVESDRHSSFHIHAQSSIRNCLVSEYSEWIDHLKIASRPHQL
jgi:hypothetical protein